MKRKRISAAVAAAALVLTGSLAVAAPSSAATSQCGITWGSLHKQRPDYHVGSVTDIRPGKHDCFDRIVIDVSSPDVQGFSVQYVDVVREFGSGFKVPVRGGAALDVTIWAPSYDEWTGEPTYLPDTRREVVDVSGFQTFRQVAWGGSFEGGTKLALGVRARLPMRAFTLEGPGNSTRLVVDVAHQW